MTATARRSAALGGGRPGSRLLAFREPRQIGVIAAPAAAGVVAGLDVRVADRAALIELFQVVSTEIELVMSGEAYERRAGGFPPLDTGILGPVPGPTGTSIILGRRRVAVRRPLRPGRSAPAGADRRCPGSATTGW